MTLGHLSQEWTDYFHRPAHLRFPSGEIVAKHYPVNNNKKSNFENKVPIFIIWYLFIVLIWGQKYFIFLFYYSLYVISYEHYCYLLRT